MDLFYCVIVFKFQCQRQVQTSHSFIQILRLCLQNCLPRSPLPRPLGRILVWRQRTRSINKCFLKRSRAILLWTMLGLRPIHRILNINRKVRNKSVTKLIKKSSKIKSPINSELFLWKCLIFMGFFWNYFHIFQPKDILDELGDD